MSSQPEIWRVSTVEGVFQTDVETLKQWIVEGCVLPTDKVSKGNLSWIEAGRVPKLRGAFNGETAPDPEPMTFESFVGSSPAFNNPTTHTTTVRTTNACQNHPGAAPEYVCRMCGALFCKECPRFVSGKVPVCPSCGDLCREYRAVRERAARAE